MSESFKETREEEKEMNPGILMFIISILIGIIVALVYAFLTNMKDYEALFQLYIQNLKDLGSADKLSQRARELSSDDKDLK